MPNSQVTAMAAASTANSSSSNTAISLGLPLAPDAPASAAPAGPAHVWIGTLRSDNDARLYWMQEVRRFPDLLQRLNVALRPVDLGAGQGVWFKVLARSARPSAPAPPRTTAPSSPTEFHGRGA
jgi:hypothetical protein